MNRRDNRRPLLAAGILLGTGLGGFVDGILFHQLLQWHSMLSDKYPRSGLDLQTVIVNLEVNMFWDGLFHTFTWLTTVAGIVLLWRAGQRADVPWCTKIFIGSLLMGWGLFNLIEGIINHHVLHLHHVVETPDHLAWDLGFLASGVIFILIGGLAVRGATPGMVTPQQGAALR